MSIKIGSCGVPVSVLDPFSFDMHPDLPTLIEITDPDPVMQCCGSGSCYAVLWIRILLCSAVDPDPVMQCCGSGSCYAVL